MVQNSPSESAMVLAWFLVLKADTHKVLFSDGLTCLVFAHMLQVGNVFADTALRIAVCLIVGTVGPVIIKAPWGTSHKPANTSPVVQVCEVSSA